MCMGTMHAVGGGARACEGLQKDSNPLAVPKLPEGCRTSQAEMLAKARMPSWRKPVGHVSMTRCLAHQRLHEVTCLFFRDFMHVSQSRTVLHVASA